MATLMQAHQEWAKRPDDERFTSLTDMHAVMRIARDESRTGTIRNKHIQAQPLEVAGELTGLAITGPDARPSLPTNWAFGQLCSLVGAPASYLRTLPPDLASDCINQSMLTRKTDEVGFMTRSDNPDWTKAQAYTGPQYGRIWNEQVVEALINRFGDGRSGAFRVPGEFGKRVDVSKENTTLFASDRDMFVFLADEENRIELPGRRNGQAGELARGFWLKNSEVGASSLRIGTFLFDYVCANRIVWGAENYQEVTIRHSSRAPMRWVDEVMPAIEQLKSMDMFSIDRAVDEARKRRLDEDAVDKVLAKRFTANQAKAIKLAHQSDEGRPMLSQWDIVTGATAYARGLKHQDARVDIESKAGAILSMA